MDIIDFVVNALGDILYGGWETFDFTETDYDYYCAFKVNKFKFKEVNKLETESLVSYLYQVKGFLESGNQTLQTEPIREIIQSLRRSEKDRGYKRHAEMWYELQSIIKSGKVYTLLPEDLSGNMGICIVAIVKAFKKIEKRHLEKPKKEIVKLVGELNKEMRELLKICEERMGD